MSEPKTRPTDASVADFLDAQPATRRHDGHALVAMMQAATGEPPVMWGSSIVGFGQYLNRTADGRETPWPVIGFAPRKAEMVVYVLADLEGAAPLFARLGKHRLGACCLYFKRMADLDTEVLRAIIDANVEAMATRRIGLVDRSPAGPAQVA